MTETEAEEVRRINDAALTKAYDGALKIANKALDDGAKLGRKYGRIEGFILGFAIGLLIASGFAIGHVR